MYHDRQAFEAVERLPDRRRRARRAHRHGLRPTTRVHLLGEVVDLVRPEEVMDLIEVSVAERRRMVVANHNLHSMHLVRVDPAMRAFFDRADLVQVDSRPLIWFGRLKGLPIRGMHRSTYLDWREHFWSLADRKGWRVFYVGGADGVADEAARRLERRYSQCTIAVQSGFFDATPGSLENAAVLQKVRDFRPDILFVGMGMPRQEAWIVKNLDVLPDCPVFNVGAAFDYEAGVQAAAPRWMGRMGVEWLYRLARDPKRLFHRYCIEPWRLVGPAVRDLSGR